MDQKSWLWPKKRSSEKTIVAISKSDHPAQENGVEVQSVTNEKEIFLEKSLKLVNDKLATALGESNSKDEQLTRSAEMTQEAIAGRTKAEAEVISLKEELDEAVRQREAVNERIMHLNTALKDCMLQLTSLREGQEQRVCDAVMRTTKEFEKAHKQIEDKLTERSKTIANLTDENFHLNKVLLVKGKIIEDLTKRSSQAEAEFNALMSRLDSVEKENSILRYEFQMLEREFRIRNEEMEFSHRSLDASHKQQLENVKKIKKLESECQRLRALTRKRLPAQVALTKIKNELEMQEQNQTVTRRKKTNPTSGGLNVKDAAPESNPDILHKELSFLVERVCDLEGENRVLKDLLARKDTTICRCGRGTQEWDHLGLISSGKGSKELALSSPLSNETSSLSSYDTLKREGSIFSIEHFKHDKDLKATSKRNTIGISEMSLMDDFVEMEKLAVVAVDSTLGSSYPSSSASLTFSDSLRIEPHGNQTDSTGKELVQVGQGDPNDLCMEIQGQESMSKRSSKWIHEILQIIMDQSCVSKKGIDELLEDIRVALQNVNPPCTGEGCKTIKSEHSGPSELLPVGGYITWKSPVTSPRLGMMIECLDIGSSLEERCNESIQFNLSQSINRLLELVRKFDPACPNGCNSLKMDQINLAGQRSTVEADYSLCVFRWKSFELKNVLQQFVNTCNCLLDEKINFNKFFEELTSALDWLITDCVSFQADSSVRDTFVNHLGQDVLGTTRELGSLQSLIFEVEKTHTILQVENEGLKAEINSMKSLHKDIEVKLQVARNKSEALASELLLSQQNIGCLQSELETAKESKRMIEDLFEDQKSINEDLDTQLTVAKFQLNETLRKLSSLEVELEDRSHCCEELEGTCLELQLQLDSITGNRTSEHNMDQEKGLQQTGWEITAASAKLAECQETILNLGKQIKALALPKEDKAGDTNDSNKNMRRHMTLLDRMLSEDDVEKENLKPHNTEEPQSTIDVNRSSLFHPNSCDTVLISQSPHCEAKTDNLGALSILPIKKRGRTSFLRKLLLKKKRERSKMSQLA